MNGLMPHRSHKCRASAGGFAAFFCLAAAAAVTAAAPAGAVTVERVGSAVVDPRALTIDAYNGQAINGQPFQQDAITSFGGWQYVGYYDAARHVCLARRKLPPDGAWQVLRLEDYRLQGNDTLIAMSMGICPRNGTIHVAFDNHGSVLHYRVSKAGVATHPEEVTWAADLFGPVRPKFDEVETDVTYPCFLATPEGNLQCFYRIGTGGEANWRVVDYGPASGGWRRGRDVDSSDGPYRDQWGLCETRSAFPNGFTYGPGGRLQYTWTWLEHTQGANHDVCYAYSDDRGVTWRNNAGAVVNAGDGKTLINVESPGIVVVPLDRTWGLMHQQAQAVDSKGRVHVAMWHGTDGTGTLADPRRPLQSRYFHYWRDEQGSWKKAAVPSEVGNRPRLLFDASDNAYLIYSTNRDPKRWAQGLYYPNGQLCIAAASAASGWTDWAIVYRDNDASYVNEMLGDAPRLKQDGVLSVFAQESPKKPRDPTALHVIDFKVAGRRGN